MKVAILSESEADESALRILVEGLLGRRTEPVPLAGLRSRGWPSVRDVLRPVLLQLHYHTDAEALVLVVDANGTVPHQAAHELPLQREQKCRLCQLRHIREETLRHARPRVDRPPLKTAIGLAVPAIEAWLRCNTDPSVKEAVWLSGLRSGHLPYSTAQLKIALYGTERPSLALETQCMRDAVLRLTDNLAQLERHFPDGFGALAQELRAW